MTSVRPSATLYREGPELDDLLADLDEQHPGQVRVVDVTYGREGGVLGFFAKRRVGVRYALDGDAPSEPDEFAADLDDPTAPVARPAASPLDELLTAAEAAEKAAEAEAMVTRGVAPEAPADASDEPNVEFARMLLDLALSKANQRRASEDAASAAFVESGTRVLPAAEPGDERATMPIVKAAAAVVTPAAAFSPLTVPAAAFAPIAPTAPIAPAAVLAPPTATTSAPAPLPAPATPAAETVPARELWTAPPPVPRRTATPQPRRRPQPMQERPVDVADLLRATRTRPVGAHRATPDAGVRTEFTLRRQLAELGVPVSWIPDGAADAYWAIEQLCTRLPAAPTPDLPPGSVFVVAGPADAAERLAHQLGAAHRLAPTAVVVAGRELTQRWQARELATAARAAGRDPVVVAVDPTDITWAAGIIAELAPDTMWTVVDATRKPADLRRRLADLGRHSDALAVVNATLTASPASVWELDAPIALLDGRPATRGTWAALLIDGLAALED